MTRWREDATRDCWGQFCYVRDLGDGTRLVRRPPAARAGPPTSTKSRSTPTGPSSAAGTATSRPARAVCVAPDHDAEVRGSRSSTTAAGPATLDLTSYAEVCLNPRRADQAHPAFAKLFLETEFVPGPGALLCRRRPRAADQKPVWAVHVSAADGAGGRRVRDRPGPVPGPRPDAGQPGGAGPGGPPVRDHRPGAGPGLQPAAAGPARTRGRRPRRVRHRRGRDPGGGPRPRRALPGPRGRRPRVRRRARGGDELRRAGPDAGRRCPVQPPGGAVVFTGPALRPPDAVAANRLGQPGLWPHAISGDRPIVLVRVGAAGDESLVRQLVQWHAYARRRGLDLDLVILDERPGDAADAARRPTSRPAPPARCSASRAGCSSWPRARSRPTTRSLLDGRGPGRPRRRTRLAGRAARAPPEAPSPSRRRWPRPPRPAAPEPARPTAAARGPAVLERPRRVHAGRPRVRDRHRRGGRRCRRPRGPTCSPTPASAAW